MPRRLKTIIASAVAVQIKHRNSLIRIEIEGLEFSAAYAIHIMLCWA